MALTGDGHAEHDAPQPSGLVSATHELPHAWKPGSQRTPQPLALHDASPLVGAGQIAPQLPQFCTLSSRSTQLAPQRLWPGAQPLTHAKPAPLAPQRGSEAPQLTVQEPQCAGSERSASQPSASLPSPAPSQSACVSRQLVAHEVPSQMARVFGGVGHGAHEVPHEPTSALGRQASPQTCCPAAHATPQVAPSQVADAPGGAGQAVHEAPQLSVSASATHTPLQSWNPARQADSHAPIGHAASACTRVGHAVHDAPQVSGEVSSPHAVPQSWCPGRQS